MRPKNHIRNVHTGWVGSSVFVTVKRTSSMGEISSSSSSSCFMGVIFSVSNVFILLELERESYEREREWCCGFFIFFSCIGFESEKGIIIGTCL